MSRGQGQQQSKNITKNNKNKNKPQQAQQRQTNQTNTIPTAVAVDNHSISNIANIDTYVRPSSTCSSDSTSNSIAEISIQSNVSDGTSEDWGDNIQNKHHSCIRIAFRNIDHLPEKSIDIKNVTLARDITNGEFDIVGMSEINLAWQKVSQQDKLEKRFRASFQYSRFVSSNNQVDSPFGNTTHQRGGTLLGCIGPIVSRLITTGRDIRRLGRWSWISIRGNKNHRTHIVSIYRPCAGTGPTTTYQQQVAALATEDIFNCPRDQFWIDLKALLDPWHQAGDALVVGGDFNDDVRKESITNFFQEFFMTESIIPRQESEPPGTYKRGKVPIDGIFCSAGMGIAKGGYTNFSWGTASTHRLAWIDVKEVDFYGGHPPNMSQYMARKLQIDDPRIVERYIQTKLDRLYRQNTIRKLNQLYDTFETTNVWTASNARQLDAIDCLRVKASRDAEKRCRKIKQGSVPWSPELQDCIQQIRYYRACIKKYKFRTQISSRTLRKLRLLQKGPVATCLAAAKEQLDLAFVNYKKLKPTALAIRYTFLADLAYAKAESHGKEGASVLLQLQQREEQRRLGMKLRLLKGNVRSGISEIMAPDDENVWQRYTDKEEIEQKLCEESVRRFTQAQDSSCLQSDQVNILGQYSDSPVANDILNGTDVSQTLLHDDFKTLAPFFNNPEAIKSLGNIDLRITNEEYKKGWQQQREKTSSSGIMHFGHFKASIYNPSLLDFDRKILELCIRTGHTLPRWKKATDVMIPKKTDSIRVDQLRTICLLAADWNFGNKLLGRRLMIHAERAKTIAPEQYGSRKQKSSILHATNKALLFEIQRQKKEDSAIIVLDAKACYDRIPIHLASLSLRRQGLPQQAVNFMMKPIYNMKHNVRTTFGESTIHYKASDYENFHGILQGNGAGPCIWVMLSSPLLDHLRSSGHGITVTNSTTGATTNIPAFALVDDTDLPTNIPDPTQPLCRPSASLSTWNQDLQAIAGALQGTKCLWQRQMHYFNYNNRWKVQNIDPTDQDLQYESATGPVVIKRVEYNKATLALGIMFSIDGSMQDEAARLKEKTLQWCDNLKRQIMNIPEVWYALTAGIMKSLTYPLLATTLSKEQVSDIMVPIFKTALPKLGICRNMNRRIIYCQPDHKGFGIENLGDVQGIQKLLLLLGKDHPTDTSLLLQEAMALCAKETGLGPNFLMHPFDKKVKALTTPGIIASLWAFCDEHQIQVHTSKIPRHHIHGNLYLMREWLIHVPDVSTILDLQTCLIYLQVETLSDILELTGLSISLTAWNGVKTSREPNWPHQPRPSTRAWTSWRRWLSYITNCNSEGILSNQMSIAYFNSHNWKWLLAPDLQTLYHLTYNQTYEIFHLTVQEGARRTHHRQFVSSRTTANHLPPPTFMAQVKHTSDLRAFLVSYSRARHTQFLSPLLPEWKECIRMQERGDINPLRNDMPHHETILVCDGSFKNGYGAAAYILTTEVTTNLGSVTGHARTTGSPEIQDSYRAELTGILAGLLHFEHLMTLWNLHDTQLTLKVVCDNIESLKVSFDHVLHPSISAKYNQFELIQSIRSKTWSNVTIKYEHVYGHQDNHTTILTYLAALNVDMNDRCREAREQLEFFAKPLNWNATLPNWNFMIIMNDKFICKSFEKTVHKNISRKSMQAVLSKKHHMSESTYNSIHWNCVSQAMSQSKPGRRRWIAKHHSGMCGVNKWRKIWKDREDDGCPRCAQPEDGSHIYLCKDDAVELLWKETLVSLHKWLDDLNTEPSITQDILCCLELLYHNSSEYAITDLVRQQQVIGLERFFEGKLHCQWAKQQGDYYSSIPSKCSGQTWCTKLILKLWDIRWMFWEDRNNTEHKNDQENLIASLNRDMDNEIDIGFTELHAKYRSQTTEGYIERILDSNNVELKRSWLRNIRAGRQVPVVPTHAEHINTTQRLVTGFFRPIVITIPRLPL